MPPARGAPPLGRVRAPRPGARQVRLTDVPHGAHVQLPLPLDARHPPRGARGPPLGRRPWPRQGEGARTDDASAARALGAGGALPRDDSPRRNAAPPRRAGGGGCGSRWRPRDPRRLWPGRAAPLLEARALCWRARGGRAALVRLLRFRAHFSAQATGVWKTWEKGEQSVSILCVHSRVSPRAPRRRAHTTGRGVRIQWSSKFQAQHKTHTHNQHAAITTVPWAGAGPTS